MGGVGYPTVEHWFQSQKSFDLGEQQMVRQLETPTEARFAGRHVDLREDWEFVKDDIMLQGLRAKFTQHDALRQKLLDTGCSSLHEASPWDKYWGYKGLDMLGKLLMQVRNELKGEL